MVTLQFRTIEYSSSKILAVEFSTHIKSHLFLNNQMVTEKPIINVINSVFKISETKAKIIEQQSKAEIKIPVGVYTRNEIETAKLLFHADEIPVNFRSERHVEKAYQNFMDQLEDVPEYNQNQGLDSWLVLLSTPFISDPDEYIPMLKMHLNTLKNLGFVHIALLDHLSSAFFSQKNLVKNQVSQDNPMGILVNIGKTTQIGIFDNKLLSGGFLSINLGTTSVLDHSKAILRDLNVRGFKETTLVQWLLNEGRVDGKAPLTKKSIRRREVNITPILNTPKVLFDHLAVTGRRNEPNSIIDGIKQALSLIAETSRVDLLNLLKTIIITGPGAFFKGLDIRMKEDLQLLFPDYQIKTIIGHDPLNCVINGLSEFLKISPKLKTFYLLEDKVLPQELDELKKEHQSDFNSTLIVLKSLKNYVHNFKELNIRINKLVTQISFLPQTLQTIMNINILSEGKFISRDFKKYLQPLMSKAEESLTASEEVQELFKQIGRKIQKLPAFIQPPLTRVFTSHVYGLKMIKTTYKDKINQEHLNTLHSKFATDFSNRNDFSLSELAIATHLDEETITGLLDRFMEKYPNWGYFDGNVVNFTSDLLQKVENVLDLLKDSLFTSLENNERDLINNLVDKAVFLYKFLIKGYRSQHNEELSERYALEKKDFENERI